MGQFIKGQWWIFTPMEDSLIDNMKNDKGPLLNCELSYAVVSASCFLLYLNCGIVQEWYC
jgi:hypothetical protein